MDRLTLFEERIAKYQELKDTNGSDSEKDRVIGALREATIHFGERMSLYNARIYARSYMLGILESILWRDRTYDDEYKKELEEARDICFSLCKTLLNDVKEGISNGQKDREYTS